MNEQMCKYCLGNEFIIEEYSKEDVKILVEGKFQEFKKQKKDIEFFKKIFYFFYDLDVYYILKNDFEMWLFYKYRKLWNLKENIIYGLDIKKRLICKRCGGSQWEK